MKRKQQCEIVSDLLPNYIENSNSANVWRLSFDKCHS